MITLLVKAGVLAPERDIQLVEAERHHLRVRRARAGDPVRLVDGRGGVGDGTLVGAPSEGTVHVVTLRSEPAPICRGLAVAAGDRERFEWLVEKAAELGVTDVIPLETERTVGVGTRVRGQHVDRLQRRACEAIKQSGAAWAPVVRTPHTLAELVNREREGMRWLADQEGVSPPSSPAGDPAWTAIGPEGGFTDAERRLLRDEGWAPVRLGRHTLRFETAALIAAALMTARDS